MSSESCSWPAIAALPASPAAAQDLVIGVAAPMTGNLAQIGKQFAEGAQLAADEVNAKGGIKGKKVVIRVEDDKGDPKDAATVAQKFASDDAVLAVLGHYSSSACFAAIPIYTKARLATITPSASHTDLTKQGGKYMFRMWSPISVYVPDLAQYTVKKLGKKNVGVVYVQNDWGIQTKDYFVKELEKLGRAGGRPRGGVRQGHGLQGPAHEGQGGQPRRPRHPDLLHDRRPA